MLQQYAYEKKSLLRSLKFQFFAPSTLSSFGCRCVNSSSKIKASQQYPCRIHRLSNKIPKIFSDLGDFSKSLMKDMVLQKFKSKQQIKISSKTVPFTPVLILGQISQRDRTALIKLRIRTIHYSVCQIDQVNLRSMKKSRMGLLEILSHLACTQHPLKLMSIFINIGV